MAADNPEGRLIDFKSTFSTTNPLSPNTAIMVSRMFRSILARSPLCISFAKNLEVTSAAADLNTGKITTSS